MAKKAQDKKLHNVSLTSPIHRLYQAEVANSCSACSKFS
jgi:hypothetical protein